MAISLTHATVAVGTEAGNGEVGKDEWNAGHTLTMAANFILGRTTAGAGAVEELSAADVRTFLNVENGADVTDTTNVTAAGALMDSELSGEASVKAINQGLATTDSPAFAGVTVGGVATTTIREVLTANRTYYVRTDGSDSNDGLTDSSGGALLTIAAAWDKALQIDLNGYTITIQMGTGTYGARLNLSASPVGGKVIFQGDTGTPSNVNWAVTGNLCCKVEAPMVVEFKGIKWSSTTSRALWIIDPGANITLQSMDFGSCGGEHIMAEAGFVLVNGNYSITGNASRHMYAAGNSQIATASITVTLTGTPAFSTAFAEATRTGVVNLLSTTYSGSATGKRYDVTLNGVINTYGGGATFLPGNATGTSATGGQYA